MQYFAVSKLKEMMYQRVIPTTRFLVFFCHNVSYVFHKELARWGLSCEATPDSKSF